MTTATTATLHEELEQIRAAHDGFLRPEDVVNFARDKATALHSRFTWDDHKAGDEYRLWQARQLIRVVVTRLPGGETDFKRYVSFMDDRTEEGGGYRAVVEVMRTAEGRATLLKEALAELAVFERKYAGLKELAEVFEAARKARKRA